MGLSKSIYTPKGQAELTNTKPKIKMDLISREAIL